MRSVAFGQLEPYVRTRAAASGMQGGMDGSSTSLVAGTSLAGPSLAGRSAALLWTIERGRQAAASEADILIEAESGTGKEVLARMIHQWSARRSRPFVAVNCAAVPEALLESELFGHAKGAYTGANAAQTGQIESAQGGTLLLDEIGEMPLHLQPKLLRVLQERELRRLGDNRNVRIDIRVLATTNRSLATLVREGLFRADLYYRLNVIALTLPPLRDRREDIPLLAETFLERYAPRGRKLRLAPEFLQRLQEHGWPGNVRELENSIRRAVAFSSGEEVSADLQPGLLEAPVAGVVPPLLRESASHDSISRDSAAHSLIPQAATLVESCGEERIALRPGMKLHEAERELLVRTLAATGGNRSHAAVMLGISLRTVRNKIREYGLPPRRDYVSD
jgi:DNA-binding NtrC family response regulator